MVKFAERSKENLDRR